MRVSLIPKEHVPSVWPTVTPLIQGAIDRLPGRFHLVDVYTDILKGDQTLWVAMDGDEIVSCWTLRIIEYPESRSCVLEWVGGKDVDDWFEDGVEVIKSYAKSMGCDMIETRGRIGWKTRAKKIGWKLSSATYEYDLKGER